MTLRRSQLNLRCPAESEYVAPVRHALAAFLAVLEFERQSLDDVTTAAGEALANIVEHAYRRSPESAERYLQLLAKIDGAGTLSLVVSDGGTFIERPPVKGRGFGLRIMRAIAGSLYIDTSEGTRIRMTFRAKR
jgi:anti-sigma regulatory factor (Ser/Thr protein kinase)